MLLFLPVLGVWWLLEMLFTFSVNAGKGQILAYFSFCEKDFPLTNYNYFEHCNLY